MACALAPMNSMSKSRVKRCILLTKKARLLSTSLASRKLPDFLRGLRIAGAAYLSAIEGYLPLYINHDLRQSGFDGDLQTPGWTRFGKHPGAGTFQRTKTGYKQCLLRHLLLIRREKACRFLRVVAAPVVELGRVRVAVAGGLLHFFELRTVL
jgi:hypothetical protein